MSGTFNSNGGGSYTPVSSDKIVFDQTTFVGPLTPEQSFKLNNLLPQEEMKIEELPMNAGDDEFKTDEEILADLDAELEDLRKRSIELSQKKKEYEEILKTNPSGSIATAYQEVLGKIEWIKERRSQIATQKKKIEYKECHLDSLFEQYPELEKEYIRLKRTYEGMKNSGVADKFEGAKVELDRIEKELQAFKEASQKLYELNQNKAELLEYLELVEQFNNATNDADKAHYASLLNQKKNSMVAHNFILNVKDLDAAIIEVSKILNVQPATIEEYSEPDPFADTEIDHIKPQESSGGGTIHGGELDPNVRDWDSSRHHTGMGGSFEGPQGTETAYDARLIPKYPKADYSKPDNALLKQLMNYAKDANDNLLFPPVNGLSEDELLDYYFGKGAPYEYHIYGVNEDGTIDQSKINDPKFGLKMLGNYIMVGTGVVNGQQQRELGSFVITSNSNGQEFPGIVVDTGETKTTTHIDMSMDQILYHLRHFAVNRNLEVKSLAGFYSWCTPADFKGPLDRAYEMMFRRYCRNTGQACPLDSPNFPYRDYLNFSSQADFVAQEPNYANWPGDTPYNP